MLPPPPPPQNKRKKPMGKWKDIAKQDPIPRSEQNLGRHYPQESRNGPRSIT
uniref:Uncharacterized protein n=1 Tax=Rhizophora mucronata TaxID=61149 RepID=A0A2P2MVF0_RHIMU